MKHFLPIIFFSLFSLTGYAQAIANPVSNMFQCSNNIFDLTAATTTVLGNQPANNYTVSYFTSLADASENTNAILNTETYTVSDNGAIIYIRVTNIINGDYDITTLNVSVLYPPELPEFSNITTCGGYILPSSLTYNYYTGPAGTGVRIPNGTIITTSQTIYVYASNAGICNSEDSFFVTITSNGDNNILPYDQSSCDDDGDGIAVFNLNTIAQQLALVNDGATDIKFYLTQENALNTGLAIATATYAGFMPQQTIYAGMITNGCYTTLPVYLSILPCSGTSSLTGTIRYNYSGTSCSGSGIPVNDVLVTCTQGTNVYHTFTNESGNYTFYNIPDGESTITAHPVDRMNMFEEDPSVTVNLPGDSTTNNLCLTVYEPFQDFRIMLVPVTQAVPGSAAAYAVIVKNMGTIVLGESQIENIYNANKLLDPVIDFSPITANPGSYVSEYGYALQPSRTQINNIYFSVAAPPVANVGDILNFRTSLTLNSASFPIPEAHILNQEVVGEFTENTLNANVGESITDEEANDYIQYTVFFRNNGTSNANTMRVHTQLNNNLDWDTFIPIASNFSYRVNRHGEDVDFIFNNINLPNQNGNENTNQGFLTYKVKPISTIAPADVITASASIYFDLNDPIVTNTVTTIVDDVAANMKFDSTKLNIYPNPATDEIKLIIPKEFNISNNLNAIIMDVVGKEVLNTTLKSTESILDISKLNTGIYIVKVLSGNKQFSGKLVIK